MDSRREPRAARPRPGPTPRDPAARKPPVVPAPRNRAAAVEQSEGSGKTPSALWYVGLISALVAVGFLGLAFKNQAEEVMAAPAISTLAPTTTIAPTTTAAPTTTIAPTTTTSTTTTTTTTTTIPLESRELARIDSVSGNISPKSVTATPSGLFFAQNMMYRHTVTVYDDQGSLLKTIDDRVDLAEFGVPDGVVARGAPVEAASTSDGRYVYVSNYAMYGPGFGPEPGDGCADSGWDNSYLYRVDTESLEIDQVIEVGAVPKFLAVSPDDRFVLVTNWCSFDLSIVDTAAGKEIARIDIGRHPRGVAISSDSSLAYITEMGGSDIAVISLDQLSGYQPSDFPRRSYELIGAEPPPEATMRWLEGVGRGPRSVILSPDDRFLYATLNGEGRVIKIDVETGEVIERVSTGAAPRSMAMSTDGTMLYVVNYNSNTMSKVRTDTMEEVQEVRTADKPIGITVDPKTANIWVSNYSGVLQIFEEQVVEAASD